MRDNVTIQDKFDDVPQMIRKAEKVLFVCTVSTENSGIPKVIFNLLDRLDSNRFEMTYVSINQPSLSFKEYFKRLNVSLLVIPRTLTNPFGYISQLAKVARNYDIMHVHGNSATMVLEMIAAKLAGVKVRIAHSHNTTCKMKIIDRLSRPLFYRLCNGRLACGLEAGKWLFGGKSFKILNNGIDVDKFKYKGHVRCKMRNSLGLEDTCVIGHIGNFVEQKNHTFLIDVFHRYVAIHPNSRLLLLGDGPLRDLIEAKVRELGIEENVIFVGSVDNPADYMNAMDLILMPSLFEGLPLTMIEEQANGLSILAADTITSDANLTGNVQYLSLQSDMEEWVAVLERIIRDCSHDESTSANGIAMIKKAKYDIDSVAEDLTSYYNELLKNEK